MTRATLLPIDCVGREPSGYFYRNCQRSLKRLDVIVRYDGETNIRTISHRSMR